VNDISSDAALLLPMRPGVFKEPPDVCLPFFFFLFCLTVQIERLSMSVSVSVSSSLLELMGLQRSLPLELLRDELLLFSSDWLWYSCGVSAAGWRGRN
jgi:hypothetical protein